MDANCFNKIYEENLCIPLQNLGFIKKGHSLFMQQGDIYLVLIRSSFRSERVARFLLCLRHSFCRDLYDRTNNLFEINPNSFPFRVKPFSLNDLYLKTWHYETYSVNDWHYDKINYGQVEEIYGGIDDAFTEVCKLTTNIEEHCFKWMNMLTPKEALYQLYKYNSGWKTETDWIEDYEKFNDKNLSRHNVINFIDRLKGKFKK